MDTLLTTAFATTFLIGCILGTVPLLLAAVGETIGERSGVLNLGVEGMMLVGVYVGYAVALGTGSIWLGLLTGAISGAVLSVFLVVLNVWFGLNQIVLGLAITLAGGGVTSVLYYENYGQSNPRVDAAAALPIPGLSELPVVGGSIFSQPAQFWFCCALVVAVALFLARSNWGLSAQAAGHKPASLDAAGGSVMKVRSQAVLLGGTFAGLGGAYLALLTTGAFTPYMTHGLGFVAIIVTMLTRGRVAAVAAVSLIYGVTVALGTAVQLTDLNIPTDVVGMLPFTAIMIILIVFARSVYISPALGAPYTRGAR